ncbi:baseplate hub subunit tail length determinator [Aeromonas phage Asfd_1]|nr:baseplate hub subunit tail length determinator [Aeromonas phage Asfd_1]
MFQDNYAELKEQLGAFATPFENIHSIITDLVSYFKSGEYMKMFERLVKGAFSQMSYLVDMIMLGLAKLGATILRAMGADEKADSLESAAVTRAASNSGYIMNDEEKEMVGRVAKRNAEEKASKADVNFIEQGWNNFIGKESETPEQRDRRAKQAEIAKNTTAAQFGEYENFRAQIEHVGETASKNETSPELLEKHKELLVSRTKEIEMAHKNGKLTDDAYSQLQTDIQDQSKLLEEKSQSISARAKTENIKTAPSEDVGRVNNVEQEERRVENAKQARQAEQTNINSQTSVVNTNNQTVVQAPRTSSPGPGIGNHL